MGFNKRIHTAMHNRGGENPIFGIRNETFFDRLNVINALETKYIKVMATLGGYTRKVMQNSMKRAKASAKDIKGKQYIGRNGRVYTVATRGQVVDEAGKPIPAKQAAAIKKYLRLKYGKGIPSKPGKPPNVHIGTLQKLIEFGYEQKDKSLVIGPHSITSPTMPLGGKSVPQLLNEGGNAYVRSMGGRKVLATYPPRPFVQPALEKGIRRFKELLETVPLVEARGRNSIGR